MAENEGVDIFKDLDDGEEEIFDKIDEIEEDAPTAAKDEINEIEDEEVDHEEDKKLTKLFGPIDHDMVHMGKYPIKSITFKTVFGDEKDKNGLRKPKLDKNGNVVFNHNHLFIAFDIFEEFDPDTPVEKSVGISIERPVRNDKGEITGYEINEDAKNFADALISYSFGKYGIRSFDDLAKFANRKDRLEKGRESVKKAYDAGKIDEDDFNVDIYQRIYVNRDKDGNETINPSFKLINRHSVGGGSFVDGQRPIPDIEKYLVLNDLPSFPGKIRNIINDRKFNRFVIIFNPEIEGTDDISKNILREAPYQAVYKYGDPENNTDTNLRTKRAAQITEKLKQYADPSINDFSSWNKAIGSKAEFKIDGYDSQRKKNQKVYVAKLY